PTSPSTFGGWSGACAGTSAICMVSMDVARTVTARFDTPLPGIVSTLSIAFAGAGRGSLSTTNLVCSNACSKTYATGTALTLTAPPATGSVFAGWSSGCSGTGSCGVVLSSNRTVTATFAPAPTQGGSGGSGSGAGGAPASPPANGGASDGTGGGASAP